MTTPNPFEEIADRLLRIENCLMTLKRDALVPANPQDEFPIPISEEEAITDLAVPTLNSPVHRRKISSYQQWKR